ncbi:hypothetical protein [Okibacterium endophyticum]
MNAISFFKRAERRTARAEAVESARNEAATIDLANREVFERRQADADAQWQLLLSHDPDTVISTLDGAFFDNAEEATCVDAGVEDGRRYATVVILFSPVSAIPERTPSLTPTGKPTTKKRTKTDRNALYVQALGSTVLATVKEAFAVAPSLDEVRVLVLRQDTDAPTSADHLTAIYSAEFERERTNALPWARMDPGSELLAADDAQFERKGVAGDIIAIHVDPELDNLIKTFTGALRA